MIAGSLIREEARPMSPAFRMALRAVRTKGDVRRGKTVRSIPRRVGLGVVNKTATVVVVDDDRSVLGALARLIRALGFQVQTFDRPTEVLAGSIPSTNACLVVDVNLPEMNGLELCEALAKSGRRLPAILITGRDDARTRRLVEGARAVEVLYKPIDEEPLLDAIARALTLSRPDPHGD